MKDLEYIKWECREKERKDLEERWRKEDQWDSEAKKNLDHQNYLDDKKWDQEDQWRTNMQRDIDNQRYLDDIRFRETLNHQRERLNYRKREMRALEERWRKSDELDLKAKSKSDYQRFLYDKNLEKW
jgi:hypothetical protein